MPEFIFNLFYAVAIQIAGILGIFFVFGFILAKLQETTQSIYRQTVGWKGILWTAWIGTPIHEFSHLFFIKIFRHKILRFSFFRPDERTGVLGYVDHKFAKYSLYQRIGNFFIGGAPLIFGSVFLFLMLYFLLPNGKEAFLPLAVEQDSLIAVFASLKQTLSAFFSPENLLAWNFWLFLYLSFGVASHLAPSKEDRKGMWRGFAWVVLLLFIANLIALSAGKDITGFILNLNRYLGVFVGIFIYAAIISFVHLLLASIILLPFKK